MIGRLQDLVLMHAPVHALPMASPGGLRLREAGADEMPEILLGHALHGRNIPPQRLQRRFAHGLRFFQLWNGDALAASTWILRGGARYIDELALAFPIAADELWVRDIFVAPEQRGQQLFSRLLATLVDQVFPHSSNVWSDVDRDNAASVRAHCTSGFRVAMRLRALELGRRVRVRQLPSAWPLPITALEPSRHVLVWNETLRARHRALIA